MEPRKLGIAFLLVSISVLLLPITVSKPLGGVTKPQVDVSAIVEKVTPAVVQIETEEGLGSGFIIQPNGYILTNWHVVIDKYGYFVDSIRVHLKSGKKYKAEVVETDEESDIALLKIQASNLPTAKIGDSDQVGILDYVIVLGYPLGSFTVTDGKVSAIREVNDTKVLQITAAINPGSSGGPVIDAQGNVIGVVSAKILQAEGFNFAVAINEAENILPTIQDMIDAAQPYGDIRIGPGTYEENLTIDKKIHLKGAGKDKVMIKGHIDVVDVDGRISIKNMTITGGEKYGIRIRNTSTAMLSNLFISDIEGDGRYDMEYDFHCWTSGSGICANGSDVWIYDTKITESYFGVLSLDSEVRIDDSIFSENVAAGLDATDSSISVENSTIKQNDHGISIGSIGWLDDLMETFIAVRGSTVSENVNGIIIGVQINAVIANNEITNNEEYGVALWMLKECFAGPAGYLKREKLSDIQDLLIAGGENTITNNGKGDVCPEELKFLMSQEGGFVKSDG